MQPSNLLNIKTLSDGWCDKDITGSTPIRMKLYQKIIKDNKANIETNFNLLAFKESDYEAELPDFSTEYQAFQITKKH